MKRLANRRAMLSAAGAAVVAVVAGTGSPQSADLSGTVQFEGGAVIPEGEIEIYIEHPAVEDEVRHSIARTRVRSDGGSRTIGFSISPPDPSAPALLGAGWTAANRWEGTAGPLRKP